MPTLPELAAAYADAVCAAYPVGATALGRHDHDSRLGEYTPATFDDLARQLNALRAGVASHLNAADPAEHADAHALDGALASHLLELDVDEQWRRNPDQAVETVLSGAFSLLLRTFAPLDDRLTALSSRLAAVPAYLDSARRVWSDVPALWAETAAESAAAGAAFFRGELRDALGDSKLADKVMEQAAVAADALDATAAALSEQTSDAPWKAGEELVTQYLRHKHHLPDTASEMEQRGVTLIEETVAQLEATDPKWRDSVTRMKEDHPSSADLVAAYRDEMERARAFVLERGLAPATDAPLDVRPTPKFWAHLLPYAAYDPPGFFERDQTGFFWVTVPEGPGTEDRLKGHFRHAITVTAVHEGFPGHHQQMTGANAAGSLLRVMADTALTVEGWAFYCEQMLWEEGYYGDDRDLRVAQLKDQLWRAARVVIDMRLHCGAMTFEEGIDELVRIADLERDNAEGEVRRYTSTPTYQICYAIGKAEILALRSQLQAKQGAGFDLGAFHARLLDFGNIAVPLSARAMLAEAGSAP
jgi:uncharacterized protein (DUF885 family)